MTPGEPEDAIRSSGGESLVAFDVSPNAAETRVPSGFDEWRSRFEARLSEPASDGRANDELTAALAELLGEPVRIVEGRTSRRKTVAVAVPPAAVRDALVRAIEDG